MINRYTYAKLLYVHNKYTELGVHCTLYTVLQTVVFSNAQRHSNGMRIKDTPDFLVEHYTFINTLTLTRIRRISRTNDKIIIATIIPTNDTQCQHDFFSSLERLSKDADVRRININIRLGL